MVIDFFTLDLLSTLIRDGFIVIDSERTIVYVNEKYCEISGITPEQVLNKKVDVIPRSKLEQTLKTGEVEVGDVYGITAEDITGAFAQGFTTDVINAERIASAIYYTGRAPIMHDGKIVGAIGVIKDSNEIIHISDSFSTFFNSFIQEVEYYRTIMDTNALNGISTLAYDSPCMQELKRVARKAAASDLPVLLTGETGTGKEVFANAIQSDSLRKDKPFIKVNCPAIPEALLESELYGYEPGAFTGAGNKARKGKFELAHKGTIFLDEVGDLPYNTQAKLLRVLQEKSFERLGGSTPIQSDFRVIAATNRDLKSLIKLGKFREDLYYRLNTIHISLPPLRKHPEDIPRLVRQMIHELNMKHRKYITLDEDVFVFLQSLYFEGNIRELKNMVEHAYAMSDDSILRVEHFKLSTENDIRGSIASTQYTPNSRLESAERTAIEMCLIEMDYNCNNVAKRLGISRATLYRKIKKYDIYLRR
jgi:transcriptional regulator with PAS, ATPase and Fis domain